MLFPEKIIKGALKEASGILMENFGGKIQEKEKESQSSIVTELDIAAEKKIAHIINQKYPDHGIIGEEKGAILTGSPYTWIIDPIDGTSNYAAGIPWFGPLLAVLENDRPIAAGAYLPYYKQMYYAEKGKGAFCNGKPISTIGENQLKKVLFAYATDYSESADKTKYETDLLAEVIKNVRNIRCTNCLVDFLYVADGRLGGSINHSTKIWDIVAPWLIISEAGGRMTDINGKDLVFDLSFDKYLKNYAIISCGSLLFDEIVRIANSIK